MASTDLAVLERRNKTIGKIGLGLTLLSGVNPWLLPLWVSILVWIIWVVWLVFFGLYSLMVSEARRHELAGAATSSNYCQSRRREYEDRARTWHFELVGLPSPRASDFVAGKYLLMFERTKRMLLREAVEYGSECKVDLRFLPHGLGPNALVQHAVMGNKLYQSSLPVKGTTISFPRAHVDESGRICDYGPEAVIYGLQLGLPEWKDEIQRMDEEPWLWQIPEHSRGGC